MPISEPLSQSIAQHFEAFAKHAKLSALEGELADTLRLFFHTDERAQRTAAEQVFYDTWADFSQTHAPHPLWPLFIYACYSLLAVVAKSTPVAHLPHDLEQRLGHLENYFLGYFFYIHDHVPEEEQARFNKLSAWLHSMPLQFFASAIATYQVTLKGSYPRYLFEYFCLLAKQTLGDTSEALKQQLTTYKQHLAKTDMDIYFSLTPLHAGINIGLVCRDVYHHLPDSLEKYLGKTIKTKGCSVTGYEYLHLRTEGNFDIILHPAQPYTPPHGNLYLELPFNPLAHQPRQFIFPDWSPDFNRKSVIDTFFNKQIITPRLRTTAYEIQQLGYVSEKHLSLLAHCLKNIGNALATGWVVNENDLWAVNFFIEQLVMQVQPHDGTTHYLKFSEVLSQRIAQLYYQDKISAQTWLQTFNALHTPLKTSLQEPKEITPAIKQAEETKSTPATLAAVPVAPPMPEIITKKDPPDPILMWLDNKGDEIKKTERITLLKELHHLIAKALNLKLKNSPKSWNVLTGSKEARVMLDNARRDLLQKMSADKGMQQHYSTLFNFLTHCKIDLFGDGDPLVNIFLEPKVLTILVESQQNPKLTPKIFARLARVCLEEIAKFPSDPNLQLLLLIKDALIYTDEAITIAGLSSPMAKLLISAIHKFYLEMHHQMQNSSSSATAAKTVTLPLPQTALLAIQTQSDVTATAILNLS